MIGKTLGHYRILEKIGAGGMGEVYRAHDTRLDRDVALKVLPAGALADESARKRFRKEALALSKLNHPNIETVHDFDTQNGVDFLVMEHIAGESLGEKVKQGPLSEKEVGRLGMQLAEGLAAAHAEGVVHRDLKPANLRVTPDGRLKILDFGLAKLLRPSVDLGMATTESLTETQGIAGTLPYMAPEQLRGEPVDARTDLWAAGAVLYEMTTGRRPFEAKLATALADDILHKPPPPPGRLNPDLAPRLEEIILKCLEKDPEHRCQSARELLADFRRLGAAAIHPAAGAAGLDRQRRFRRAAPLTCAEPPGTRLGGMVRRGGLGLAAVVLLLAVLVALNVGGWRERLFGRGPAPIQSLAVLPLGNLSGDPDQEYFSDGMTEALIAELGKISALRVISRQSVMRYKGTDEPLPEIARELNVDALVEGSTLQIGERVRITTQLIGALPERHLWANSYDRELSDILVLQSEVARAIAREIKIAVTPEEEVRLARARRVNPAAYAEYLKGQYQWNKLRREGWEAATGYFQQSIEKDPSYAPAHAMISFTYSLLGYYSPTPPAVLHSRALAAAERAVALDNSLAEAHASLALVKTSFDWDWAGGDRASQEALRLNPSSTMALYSRAFFLSWVGRHEEAIAIAKRAVELDPVAPHVNTWLGMHYFLARRYDQAIGQLNKVVALEPDYRDAHLWLCYSYAKKGMYEEAARASTRVRQYREEAPWWPDAWVLALAGRSAEGRKLLEQTPVELRGAPIGAYFLAIVLYELGEKDRAFAALEQAYQSRTPLMSVLKVDPRIDSLRSDPRFQSLLRRMGLAEDEKRK